ncbi:MAG: ABC transporter ATP-binding protein/permease [Ruminococcus sp.]|jgi:ATP-binding cassette subfamily B protein|nr:ABC transporter ATP-binding protein/permease [Ruminococcus sp.]
MIRIAKRFYKKYLLCFILGPFAKLTEAVFELISPLIMADIIDNGVKEGRNYVIHGGIIMLILGVLGLGSALVCQYLGSRASMGVGTDLRRAVFSHINRFSHSQIDKFGSSSLITRMNSDITAVQWETAMLIRLVVRAPFIAVGAAITAIMIDKKLALIFIAVIPLIIIIFYFIITKSVPLFRLAQKKLDKMTLIFSEHLKGVRVIRAFLRQKDEKARFETANKDYTDTLIFTGRLTALSNPLSYAVLNISIAVVLYLGGFRVNAGDITQGELIAFINYLTQISLALAVVANLATVFTKGQASASRVCEILETPPKEDFSDYEQALSVNEIDNPPALSFENVSFRYENAPENALTDISFTLNAGELLGITGITGEGKSTLINLIPRFFEISEGEIFVDGVNAETLSLKALRKKIAVVPQKSVLFSGTVLSNLRFGNPQLTENEAEKALAIAQISEISPDREVSQGGSNFSGGQRQRICIARAIASNPEILILDDSFSALDRKTESHLRRSLKENFPGTSIIAVSQRLSSIMNADKILVLSDGKNAGLGTHSELLKTSAIYREIAESQGFDV